MGLCFFWKAGMRWFVSFDFLSIFAPVERSYLPLTKIYVFDRWLFVEGVIVEDNNPAIQLILECVSGFVPGTTLNQFMVG